MRGICLLATLFCAAAISGCAVIESPRSWGCNNPGSCIPSLAPNALDVGGKTVNVASNDVNTFQKLDELITNTKAAVASKQEGVRKDLDRASAGNYGWGLLAAGTALWSAPIDVIKGVGFLGGTHLALSTRLSPKDQLATLTDTISRLECVAVIARNQKDAVEAARGGNKTLNNAYSSTVNPTIKALIESTKVEDDAPNLDDYKAAIQKILYSANAKLDGLYVNALDNKNIASDLVTTTNTYVSKLQQNAAQAMDNNNKLSTLDASAAATSKAAADLKKNAADVSAAVPTKLATCLM